jgi:YbbR domain-containing protein
VDKTFLQVDVETIDVTIAVVKEKTVPLTVSVVNSSGGTDSTFCTAKVEPETIKITGNAEVLDAINAIDLGVIDVAERTKSFETSISVVLPNGVKNVDNIETVKVAVTFNDVQTKTIKVKNLSLQNLPDGTTASVQEDVLTVKVRGIAEDLKQLNDNNVSLVADVRNQVLPGGTNRLTAVAVFPDNLKVGAVGKYQLTVVVS